MYGMASWGHLDLPAAAQVRTADACKGTKRTREPSSLALTQSIYTVRPLSLQLVSGQLTLTGSSLRALLLLPPPCLVAFLAPFSAVRFAAAASSMASMALSSARVASSPPRCAPDAR